MLIVLKRIKIPNNLNYQFKQLQNAERNATRRRTHNFPRVLVGREGFKAFCKKSGQGAVPIKHVPTIGEAVEFLRERRIVVRVLLFACVSL